MKIKIINFRIKNLPILLSLKEVEKLFCQHFWSLMNAIPFLLKKVRYNPGFSFLFFGRHFVLGFWLLQMREKMCIKQKWGMPECDIFHENNLKMNVC